MTTEKKHRTMFAGHHLRPHRSDKNLTKRHLLGSLLATLIVVSLPPLVSAVRAQEASPSAGEEEMEPPEGATFAVLAELAPVALPPQAALAAVRLTLEPGAQIPPQHHEAVELAIVESRMVPIRVVEGPEVVIARAGSSMAATPEMTGPGQENTLGPGDVMIVPAGNVTEAQAGDQAVTMVFFEFHPLEGEAPPEA